MKQQTDCKIYSHNGSNNRQIAQLYAEFNILKDYIKTHTGSRKKSNGNNKNNRKQQGQSKQQQKHYQQYQQQQQRKSQFNMFTPQVKRKRNNNLLFSQQQQQKQQNSNASSLLQSSPFTAANLIAQYTLLYQYSIKKVIQHNQRHKLKHKKRKEKNKRQTHSNESDGDDQQQSMNKNAINQKMSKNSKEEVSQFKDMDIKLSYQANQKQEKSIARKLMFDQQHSHRHLSQLQPQL